LKQSKPTRQVSVPLFGLLLGLSWLCIVGLVDLAREQTSQHQALLIMQQQQLEARLAYEDGLRAKAHAELVRYISQKDFYEAPAAPASQIARFERARQMNDLVTGSLPDFKIAAALAIPLRNEEVARAVEVYAHSEGVPALLAVVLIQSESGYKTWASNKGAKGLMQIKLVTARQVGYEGDENGLLDPLTNLQFGMRHLGQIYRMAHRDACRTVAIYRSGNLQARPSATEMAVCAKFRSLELSRG
jgi:soluble lytic murein transglycosylase-like protein